MKKSTYIIDTGSMMLKDQLPRYKVKKHKLIYVYGDGLNKSGVNKTKTKPTWEFYDLENDPFENSNEINKSDYKSIIISLRDQLIIEKEKSRILN